MIPPKIEKFLKLKTSTPQFNKKNGFLSSNLNKLQTHIKPLKIENYQNRNRKR